MWDNRHPVQLWIALLCACVVGCVQVALAQGAPTLSTCDGRASRCASAARQAACFRIDLNGFTGAIAEFGIDWGDGTSETVAFAEPLPDLTHVYELRNWGEGCDEAEAFAPTLSTVTAADPSSPLVTSAAVAFRLPPRPIFAIAPGNVVCVGDVVRVTPQRCNQTEDRFDFGDGASSATGLTYVYSEPGTYIITHSVEGECGQEAGSRTITVLDKPVAAAEVTAGVTVRGEPLTVCLDADSAEVIVSGLTSTGANRYSWTVTPAVPLRQGGAAPIDTLAFAEPGDYTVTLTVSNACNAPSSTTLRFRVVAAPRLRLAAAPDLCAPTQYTPRPLIPEATYTINGVPQTTWPYEVSFGDYTVVARLSNACGDQELTDEFIVVPPSDIAIASPAAPRTVLCVDADPIELTATPPRGRWSGAPDIEVTPAGTRFVPKTPGSYDLTYTTGSGACAETATRTVVVEAFTLALGAEPDACQPFDYTPTPLSTDASYEVDGRSVRPADFPLRLGFGTHTVAATQTNACGTRLLVDTFAIAVPDAVSIELPTARDTTVCASSELVRLRANLSGGRWTGAGTFADPRAAATTFDPTQVGLTTLTYTRGEGACARSASVDVDVEGIVVVPEPIGACVGDASVALSNAVPGGVWTSAECPGCVTGDTFTFPAGGAAVGQAFTVRYDVSSANGCVGSAVSEVEVFDPRAAFEAPARVCLGDTIVVTLLADSAAVQDVAWTVDGQPTTPPFAGLAAGSYRVEATATRGACRDVATRTVEVVAPPPALQIVADRAEGCGPLDVTLGAAGTPPAGDDYRWDFAREAGDTLVARAPAGPITFNNLTPDTVSYAVTLTSSNECGSATDQRAITVYPQPYAEIGTDSAFAGCSPYRVVFSNRNSRNADACRYYGVPGLDIRDCRDTFGLVLTAAEQTEVYPVILEARNGCGTDRDTALITVAPPGVTPLFNLDDADYAVCPGQPLTFSDASTPRPTTLEWDLGNGATATGDTVRHVYERADTSFAVRLRVSTGCGYAEQTRVVTVLSRPAGALEVPPVACVGAEVEVRATTAEPGVRLDFGNGDGSGAASAKTRYDSAGLYVVTATFRDADGCADSVRSELLVAPLPEPEVSRGDTACVGQTLQASVGGANVQTAAWRLPDGSVASGAEVAWVASAPGVQMGVVTARSDEGCVDSVGFTYFVRRTPVAGFSVSGDSTCVPTEIAFADASTGPGVTSYDYRFGDGGTSEFASGTYTYREGGAFEVTQVVGIDGFCFDTAVARVRALPTPRLAAALVDERCLPGDVAYLDVTTGADERVGVVGPGLDTLGGTRFALAEAGSYLVTATTPFGCDTSAVVELAPWTALDLRLLADTSIGFGDSLRLRTQVNYANLDYRWTPDEGFAADEREAPWVRPLTSTTYELTVTHGECVARETVRVTVIERDPVAAPTAFSPNGDGVNDVWEVFPNASIRALRRLSVFDRWGNLVYEREGLGDWRGGGLPLKAWDGYARGQQVTPGVFAWVLVAETFTGEARVVKGSVTVVE